MSAPAPSPFSSRWAPLPAHARELPVTASLPDGFRAAGVACGIKESGRTDLGLLVCDADRPVSAACFTASRAPAAPVGVCREHCRLDGLRAVLVNSGCANAATGRRGVEDALACQRAAALATGFDPAEVALASTGGISHHLPMDSVLEGIAAAAAALAADGGDFQGAIMTTDAYAKRATLEISLGSASVRLSAHCKGAGMISPRFATMLCFLQTDALLSAETAQTLLSVCVGRSFDRISVDGQLSTNDTVILMASGSSGVRIDAGGEDELRFGEALDALLRALAVAIVRDGEGAGRIARVLVRGGDAGDVEAAARAVGNSPLVKAALHGGDPNWGRILQAVGGALAERGDGDAPLPVGVFIEGLEVCRDSAALAVPESDLARLVAGDEVEYEVQLPGVGAEAELIFSDLSRDYVTVNADYST